jgi:hypothetical protein
MVFTSHHYGYGEEDMGYGEEDKGWLSFSL